MLTVMVAFLVDVPPLLIAGVGALKAAVPAVTVKAPVRVLLVPLLEVPTVTLRAPVPAALVMLQVPVTWVAVAAPTVQVTPVPLTVMAFALCRAVPVKVTGMFETPRDPDVGLMEASVGAVTVNALDKVTLPSGEATVTFLRPVAAVAAIVQEALT